MADLDDYETPPGYGETIGAVRELGPADEVKFWQEKCADLEAEVARLKKRISEFDGWYRRLRTIVNAYE